MNATTRTTRSVRSKAFTLAEVLVAMAIFTTIMAMMLTINFYGMKMYQVTKSKLGASDDARRAVSLLSKELREAKIVRIGNGSLSTFTEVAANDPQRGNAIEIYRTTNTTTFVRYFLDDTDKQLKRTENGLSVMTVVANFVTNSAVFTREDYLGNTLSNNNAVCAVGLALEFYQIQYPIVEIGPGKFYDYYRISTKTTPRTF